MSAAQPRRGDPLTRAELAVLERVAAGRRNTGAAADLHLSIDAVKTHLQSMFVKLGAHDRAHLITCALEQGYLWVGYDRRIRVGDRRTHRVVA